MIVSTALCTISDRRIVRGCTVSVADVIPTSGQATYFDKDHLPTHGPDTHGSGWTTFNLDPGRQDFYGVALPGTQSAAAGYAYDVGAAEWV